MKGVLAFLLAVACAWLSSGASDRLLPFGGPFVNEDSFPEDGDPNEYYWVELALVDGDGPVVIQDREPGESSAVSFQAMEGDVNRVLLYKGNDKWRHYIVRSPRAVRILYVSHGGFVSVSGDNPIKSECYRPVKYRPESEAVQKANLALIRREAPVPSFKLLDPDLDAAKSEASVRKLREERRTQEEARRREEWKRRYEREDAERTAKYKVEREREQLARVEKAKAEFEGGKPESGLVVSFYHAAYSRKLSAAGRNADAARSAAEAFKWLRKSADAGSTRARQLLGRHLLNGGGARHFEAFFCSGSDSGVPPDNAFVHPVALQGTDVPADVLLSETNGVKTYYRVYSRDPVEGVRQMKLAAEAGDFFAKDWISVRETSRRDLSTPEWFLAKDGFSVPGKTAVAFEEVLTKPSIAAAVKRKIGRDAEGRVVSVSDEYFEDPRVALHLKSPWHEAGAACVITEVLP